MVHVIVPSTGLIMKWTISVPELTKKTACTHICAIVEEKKLFIWWSINFVEEKTVFFIVYLEIDTICERSCGCVHNMVTQS